MRKSHFGISQPTRDLVKELWRKPTLLERLTGDERTLTVLQKIRNAREPAAIRELISLGLARNDRLRTVARATIGDLVALLPLEVLPALDESFRRAWGYLEYWHGLRPEDVSALQPSSTDDWAFVRLMASHRSGYVRAETIKIIGDDPSSDSLPFILLRLVDWVDQVRSAAEFHVRERLRPEYADAFVSCLPLLRRLEESTRLRPACTEQVFRLLCGPACSEAVRRGLRSESHLIRRECFRLGAVNPAFSPAEVIEQASTDRDVVVRKWAFLSAVVIVPQDWPRLRELAVADPYSPIRRIAFESLEAEPNVQATQFFPFLLDRSAGIRRACQSLIGSRFQGSAVDFYRNAIGVASARTIDICVLGLTETGDHSDAFAIARWLPSSSSRTRCAVIRGLRTLKADHDIDLLALVAAEVPSVAREAAISLLVRDSMPAYVLWQQCLKNPDPRVWLGILKLLPRTGKWAQIRVYMGAVNIGENRISAYAVEQLQRWVDRYNRSFAQPTSSDWKILEETFERVRGGLPSDLTRELSFLLQTAFR
jgi:hypothetical protein